MCDGVPQGQGLIASEGNPHINVIASQCNVVQEHLEKYLNNFLVL